MATTTTVQRPPLSVPLPLAKLFSYFPLKTYPPLRPAKIPIVTPLLWIHPPHSSAPGKESVLSADVECLKWQAHIALRGLHNVAVRWDVSQEGALDGRLPNLQIPNERTNNPGGGLLAAQDIPTWIDGKVGALDDLDGYKDVESRDESHAWIALLEGDVHAALVSPLQPRSHQTFIRASDYRRRWPSPHLPSFIKQSSSSRRRPINDQSKPSSRPHQDRSLASRLLCPLTACVSRRVPSPRDTVTQSPLSPSVWGNTNGSSAHRT